MTDPADHGAVVPALVTQLAATVPAQDQRVPGAGPPTDTHPQGLDAVVQLEAHLLPPAGGGVKNIAAATQDLGVQVAQVTAVVEGDWTEEGGDAGLGVVQNQGGHLRTAAGQSGGRSAAICPPTLPLQGDHTGAALQEVLVLLTELQHRTAVVVDGPTLDAASEGQVRRLDAAAQTVHRL